MNRAALTLFACLMLAAGGCGSSDDEGGGGSSSSSSSATAPSPSGGADASSSTEATIKSFAFDPDRATIKAGGTITWTNEDSAAHNVVFDDQSVKSIENLDEGQSGEVTFDNAGTFPYVCTYHSGMKGTVEVQ